MRDSSAGVSDVRQPTTAGLLSVLLCKDTAERIAAIEALLQGPTGQTFRQEIGKWVLQFLPAEALVPDLYSEWRPLVRDAMLFMLTRLSSARLAPKLVEQVELPPETKPEVRLLRLIAKVPGLQKLGQVLARNRHLAPSLRRALTELENGISDVNAEQIREIIVQELGPRLEQCAVEINPAIFCEASVSAVVRFTWWNPDLQERERGVFKVMKPYIRECFAEDMDLLAQLARHLGSKHGKYGFAEHVLPDTFNDVRRLLQHEVDFPREQESLVEAEALYRSVRRVRIPRVIRPLCTSKITAITEEHGKKITDAVRRMPSSRRAEVSDQMINALIAIPLFTPQGEVMFHADPHAGNLLYDQRTGNLVILDWALTEHLTHAQRRHLAVLFLMIFLRDPIGTSHAIEALSPKGGRRRRAKIRRMIREGVARFLDQLPIKHVPGAVDAMDLLEDIAFQGVRLPTPLVMLRKALFTLDGILYDIGAPDFSMESVMARHLMKTWIGSWKGFGSPLAFRDWMQVQFSALLFPSRFWLQGAQTLLQRSRKQPATLPQTKRSRKHAPRTVRRASSVRAAESDSNIGEVRAEPA
ncbi:MAG TPA: AarF/UbiB family protein [Terriglobales bacterium]|nr:AarF/UbiB family protein [Terriglobales bacterium]